MPEIAIEPCRSQTRHFRGKQIDQERRQSGRTKFAGHETIARRAELAIGAIAGDGVRVLNKAVIHALHISRETIAAVCAEEKAELKRRERLYRGERPALSLHDRTVILVDDGLATGSSMRAAVVAVRHRKPHRIVVAVPVGATDTCAKLESQVDEVICISRPEPLVAVGFWYEDFSQTTDEEVQRLLMPAEPDATESGAVARSQSMADHR
jgi:putative phosphoribosyl transferase